MTTDTRNSRNDVVTAAARLFAERGYHATSMRDIGRALGLHGSSLYSHITSKEDLLVEVVEMGGDLFDQVARRAAEATGIERLHRLIAGHLEVITSHRQLASAFLNQAMALDPGRRGRIVGRRDGYERHFREALGEAAAAGAIRTDVDPKITAILILSMLNSADRWYRPDGPVGLDGLAAIMFDLVLDGISAAPAG